MSKQFFSLSLLLIVVGNLVFVLASCQQGGQGSQAIEVGAYTILDTRTDLADRARAKQNVEDTLIRYPDVGCLVGLWAYNGPAILSAVKDAGLEGQANIVCFDEEIDTLQGVRDKHIHATVVQQPYQFGYHSVRILAALARGDQSVLPANGIFDIPVEVVRTDTVDDFQHRVEGYLQAAKAPAPEIEGDDPIKVGFITNNVSEFWQLAKAGTLEAQAEYQVECDFQMPPTGTPDEQQRMVEAMMARGLSGLAISPNDAENQLDMINNAAEVMNVLTHDSDASKSNRLCYVGTNNYLAGREAGKLIKEVLPDGGTIVMFVGRMDALNAIERHRGILDELGDKPIPESM